MFKKTNFTHLKKHISLSCENIFCSVEKTYFETDFTRCEELIQLFQKTYFTQFRKVINLTRLIKQITLIYKNIISLSSKHWFHLIKKRISLISKT